MVNRKRTYSQRDKQAAEQEARRKRSKSGDDDELCLPNDHRFKGPQKSQHLLKKGIKKYGGPTSLPDGEDDFEIEQESNKNLSIWDKALKGKLKSVNQKQRNVYGNREDFQETMKDKTSTKKSDGISSKNYLPTPPSELQKKQGQRLNQFFPNLNGAAAKLVPLAKTLKTKPTATPKPVKKIAHKDKLKQTYVVKKYESDKVSAPRKNILGDRMSSKSIEVKSWSINQANSPFLRLPGEIRNRIYEYALGGNTINIGYQTYHSSYEKVVPVFKYHCTVFSERVNPYKDRQNARVNTSRSFTLLNNICRQLYLETTALPYKLNTIAFDSHNTMINFILIERRLSPQQRHALTQLFLPNDIPGANMLTFLPNLEKVFLGFTHTFQKPQGFYIVIREEGKQPRLVKPSRY